MQESEPVTRVSKLLKEFGHVPTLPANQYCAKCGCALFTKHGGEPCPMKEIDE